MDRKQLKEAVLLYTLSALSGILLVLCFPPFSISYLGWGALIPLFYAVNRSKSIHQVANLGGLTGLIFYAVSLRWFFNVFGFMAIGLICVIALFISFTLIFTKKAINRFGEIVGWLIFCPVLWVGFEYFRSERWFLEFTWFGLGYSQVNNPILQTASIWGTYGISFFIVLSSGLIVMGLNKKRLIFFLIGLLIPIAFILLGKHKIASYDTEIRTGKAIKVALLQDESFDLSKLLKYEQQAVAEGAGVVVWPEYAVQFSKDFKELILFKLKTGKRDILRIIGGMILHSDEALTGSSILGGKKEQKKLVENFALVLNEQAEILGRYDKRHPIPIVEKKIKPSKKISPVDTAKGRIGIQICYDLDFEDGTRKLVRKGAEAILVTNLDPLAYGKLQHQQHSAMSVMRAAESGLWIARAASSGISQIINPIGRIINSLAVESEGILTGAIYLKKSTTFYTRTGWLLPKICLVLTIVFCMLLMFINKKCNYSGI
ncbi:MAG: nitrilase-related carbon-nitrogen hydrolase [Elusimicrobiota bacterium]